MALDQTPPQTKYLTTHELKARSWTTTMIAQLLPWHDASCTSYIRLPGNAQVKLYLRARVDEAELGDDFLMAQEKVTNAKVRRDSAARMA